MKVNLKQNGNISSQLSEIIYYSTTKICFRTWRKVTADKKWFRVLQQQKKDEAKM